MSFNVRELVFQINQADKMWNVKDKKMREAMKKSHAEISNHITKQMGDNPDLTPNELMAYARGVFETCVRMEHLVPIMLQPQLFALVNAVSNYVMNKVMLDSSGGEPN